MIAINSAGNPQEAEVPAWRVGVDRYGGGITSQRQIGAVLFIETARPIEFACLRCTSRRPFRARSLAVLENRLLCKGCGQLLAKASHHEPTA